MYEKLPSTLRMNSGSFKEPGLDDKLEDLKEDGSNVMDIFYRNYCDWLIWTYKSQNNSHNMSMILNKYENIIRNGQPPHSASNDYLGRLLEFAKMELNLFSESVKLVLEIQQKENWKHYVKHIKKNLWRYEKLDKLTYFLNPKRTPKQIDNLAKGKMDLGFVDIKTLQNDTHNMLIKADQMYFENEISDLHPNPVDTYENIGKTLNCYFKFDYYKNPQEYEEFPDEKIIYLKTLKTWLIMLLNKRKEWMEFEQLPKPHLFIESYALSLVQSVNQTPAQSQVDANIQEVVVNQPINLSFPTHIFRDLKSYEFFWFIAQNLETHAQLSFLFRSMQEEEKPPMIVVKDTPFREWFNSREHPVKLETVTKTYFKTVNRDRLVWYNLTKALFFND